MTFVLKLSPSPAFGSMTVNSWSWLPVVSRILEVRTLTGTKIEELNLDFFHYAMDPVDQVLNEGGVIENEVDDVVLVDRSIHILEVHHLPNK